MQAFLFSIDRLSAWSGKFVAWIILLLTALMSFDIFARYLSKAPFGEFVRSIWFTYYYSYDMSYYLYAIVFMIGGAYTLSRAQHVRGDIFYRKWPVRVQGAVDLTLFLLAFFPGILALVWVGSQWALLSWSYQERTGTNVIGTPLYPLKTVIPIAGVLMAVQGVAETIRAFTALRTGQWPQRLADVEETETILARQSEL